MIYFTSDLHIGHANIIKFCDRPFSTVHEMDETLIENWNARVTDSDTVYILGDLMFRNEIDPEEVLSRLKGRKYLITGNHDKKWMHQIDLKKHFEKVSKLMVLRLGKKTITLCHYPMMAFEGNYLIYGHIHNNKSDLYYPLLKTMENALNAGVEINGYMPVTFEELVENNRKFKLSKD